MSEAALTLVLDVGKTRTKLLAIAEDGKLIKSWERSSRSVDAAAGYLALDTAGVQTWLCETMAGMGRLRKSVRSIVPITHGAAIAGIGPEGLVLPVADYEFAGFDERTADWGARLDPFSRTLSPILPLGLNAATQLDWLDRHLPQRTARVERWMPYAQYWAWWLSGVATSEVSALGCHTQLWLPREGEWSMLARREGWAGRFAPLRNAWETLGTIRPELARCVGLPAGVRVLCGAHDSNACLARYLRSWPRMTLVSSGTWVVVMASSASLSALEGEGDFLANVSVRGEPVPTGRFMGGRDIERICAGADPKLADPATMRHLAAYAVTVERGSLDLRVAAKQSIPVERAAEFFDERERATLAALYAAQETCRCVRSLGAVGPLTVDGPLAGNKVFLEMLAALHGDVYASDDVVEGTARGGHVLAHWTDAKPMPPRVRAILVPADAALLRGQLAVAA